jgi:hypothetical protein
MESIADCKNCSTVNPKGGIGTSTYVFALKTSYHEDKAKDFKITRKAKITYKCECEDCGEEEEYHKIYEQTCYENTEYIDIDPPEFPEDPRYDVVENWYCPIHSKTKLEPFQQYVEWFDVDEEYRRSLIT